MSTRMQQRRGTSSQWTTSNPVLAAGEIGFETNTGKFKMGDGTSTWSALSYFTDSTDFDTTAIQGQISTAVSNAVDALVSGAPAALDTLNEIAAAINNDQTFYAAMTTELNKKMNKLNPYIESNLNANTFKVVNLAQPTSDNDAATKLFVDTVLNDHATDTTNIHGIGDTANLATKDYANTAISTHSSATTGIHGITDTQALATKTYADTAVSTHNSTTTNVHGISNTADLATKTYATSAGTTAVSTHNSTTTNVHGIADTSVLATATTVATAKSEAITAAGTAADTKVSTAVAALTKSSVGLANVDNTADTAKPVSTAQQTALNAKLALAGGTMTGALTLSGAPTSDLHAATKLYVDGIAAGINFHQAVVAASAGNLAGVYDNGTNGFGATITASANGAIGTIDGAAVSVGSRVLLRAQTDATQNGIYTVTNVGGASTKWVVTRATDADNNPAGELATGDFTFVTSGSTNASKGFILTTTGTITIGTTNVNYAQFNASEAVTAGTNITKSGSTISVADAPTFSGAVTASSGIVFSDGTQTKVGVPSITTIATAISSSATLAAGEADKFVPLTGAVQITLPATGYSTGQSIDFYQASGTGASFASTNSVVGTPGLKFRTTYSVVTAMKISGGWLVFGDLSA
jgi:hypothetical protein